MNTYTYICTCVHVCVFKHAESGWLQLLPAKYMHIYAYIYKYIHAYIVICIYIYLYRSM